MPNRKRKVIAVIAVAVGLTLGTSGIAEAVTVGVRGVFNGTHFVWSPKVRTITRGTTVRWRAVDGNHTVKSRGANWSYVRNLPLGSSVALTFNRRGTFRYYCTLHGSLSNGVCTGMCGRIVVS
jgi:plastocyanin